MAMDRATLEGYLREAFPDAVIGLKDLAGDNDHWSAEIVSEQFRGKSRVARMLAELHRSSGTDDTAVHPRAGLRERIGVSGPMRDNAIGVRRLGFGVSGPHGSPLIRPLATVEMILHAFALGVRVFDTAPAYGAGEAERRLGEALARLPPYAPIVST